MRLFGSLSPPRDSAFPSSRGCESLRFFWACAVPVRKVVAMLGHLMLVMSAIQHQIFESIVASAPVQMVNAFLRLKQPPKVLFHHKAVLKHVAVSVRLRMLWGIGVNVAGSMHVSAPAPLVAIWSCLRVMARQIAQVLTLVVAAPVVFGDGREFPAAAHAQAARVRRFHRSSSAIHRLRLWRARPMSPQIPLAGFWREATTACAGGLSINLLFHAV